MSGKPKLNFFRYLFWKIALKKIHKITFPTLETLNYFKKLNIIDPDKLKLLYDPVIHAKDLNKFKYEEFSKFKNFHLAIGRFTKQKNVGT